MKKALNYTVMVPEGVEVTITGRDVTVKGKGMQISRPLTQPGVDIKVVENKVMITTKKATKREKMFMGTIRAHITNMIKGLQEPFVYKCKICSSHFPMNVTVSNNELVVKNYLGEKVPRTIKFDKNVTVNVNGDVIEIESADIELAGRTASKFERLTALTKRDRRIFQDGIYIMHKVGVDMQ